jgi:quinol-cytochrome oxidoreductase complex cytochrome b subunit
MSFWGATVITSLVTVVPVIGENIVNWIWGGYSVGNPTLMRFFVIHYLLPFIILALVMIHLILLHTPGSSNPLNFEKKNEKITFFPYFYFKDIFLLLLLLIFFVYIVCYFPNLFNHADNYIKANPMSTPKHIVPEWYFLPFYAILRAISNKSVGIILFAISLGIFFFLPFLNMYLKIKISYIYYLYIYYLNLLMRQFILISLDCRIIYIYNSIEYISIRLNKILYNKIWFYSNTLLYRQNFWILTVIFIALGYIGQLEVNNVTIELGQNFTLLYFLIIVLLSLMDRVFFYFFNILVVLMYIKGIFFKGFFGNIIIHASV